MKPEFNLDAVRELALDVWDDLGRTRLAGVAVGLALALLAISVIVLRPSGDAEVASEPLYETATAVATTDEVTFTLPGEKPLKLADVDLSAARDPFRSLDGMAGSSAGGQTLLPVDQAVQDEIIGSPTTASTGGFSTAGYDDTPSLTPINDFSTTGGTTGRTGAPGGEVEPAGEPEEPAPPVTDYSYAADIQFGRVDDLERFRSVQRLGLVPSRRMPLLMYLGVSPDHETAVFMVDSRLSQGGEGRCVPRKSLCTFLELRATGAQDEHHFRDADGNEYLLRLRRLVRTTGDSTGTLAGRDVSQLRGSPPVIDGAR